MNSESKHIVVSFSGGRTSAFLVVMLIAIYGKKNINVIFLDTGAEHPETYEFVRRVVKYLGISITCLRTNPNEKHGVGTSYEVISVQDIKQDLIPFKKMMYKYGTPYIHGAFCTRELKTTPFKKYCDDTFGKNNYITWLGIRADEPKRLKPREGFKYLADISEATKEDILDYWAERGEVDLRIPEHLGNCVFCIKKGVNKIALAAKDEPRMAEDFINLLHDTNIRVVETRSKPSLVMYRGENSLESIIDQYKDIPADEIRMSLRNSKRFESGSCSESCELIAGVDDNVNWEDLLS